MKKDTRYLNISNWILVQILWFACVIGGTRWALAVSTCYWISYFHYIGNLQKEWRSIMIIAGIGFGMDMLLSSIGIIEFNHTEIVPLWLMMLWLGFATLFHHGLEWLISKPFIAAALGAVTGPTTYLIGIHLSKSSLNTSLPLFISLYALLWALYIPWFLLIADNSKSHSSKFS